MRKGYVEILVDRCKGCEMCVAACPFGAMGFDHVDKKVIKCDTCNGDPVCVKFCETKAIDYVDSKTQNLKKMKEAGKNFAQLMLKAHGA